MVDVPVVQVVLAILVVVNDRCARLRLCRKLLRSRSYCSSSSSTFPCCYAEVDPHGLRDPGVFTVAVLFLVVDVPVDRLCRFFVAVCVKTVEIPQLRLVFPIRRMLGLTADTSSCVDFGGWVLLVTFHLAQCSLPLGQAHEAWCHGRYAQKDIYELGSGKSRMVLLVAMHLALCSLR